MSNDDEDDGEVRSGEVLDASPDLPPSEATLLALISNYTERPDLFLAEVEKHDPGFIKRMNAASQERADRGYEARFRFSKFQAYASLVVMVFAAFFILSLFAFSVYKGGNFWTIVALCFAYAITQGGSLGFHKVIDSLTNLIRGAPSDKDKGK